MYPPDPDPPQNVMDPQHRFSVLSIRIRNEIIDMDPARRYLVAPDPGVQETHGSGTSFTLGSDGSMRFLRGSF
jgi:hypothetical protein